jgi:hypothetical protein
MYGSVLENKPTLERFPDSTFEVEFVEQFEKI